MVTMMLKINKKRIKENIEKIKSKYLMVLSFIIANLINGILLRGVTVGEPFRIQPLFIDLGLLILISLLSLFFKRKNRPKYFFIISIVLTLVCLINSIYYHYYSSFASISLLSNLVYAKDVGNAIKGFREGMKEANAEQTLQNQQNPQNQQTLLNENQTQK